MPQTIVVVTFYSRGGTTEKLATAAAVGAVQARAGIRMRRIPDPDPEALAARAPEHRETLQRMLKEYIGPREADIAAAHALILASPPDVDAASAEWAPFIAMLERLSARGELRGKVAAVVDTGPAARSFVRLVERLGLAIVPRPPRSADGVADATALGRAAVSAAHAASPQ